MSKNKPQIDLGNSEMRYHGEWYSFWPDENGGHHWTRDGKQVKDAHRVKRLNFHLQGFLKERKKQSASESAEAREPAVSVKPKKARKTPALPETGQARNGSLYLYDDPKKEGEKYYCILRLENQSKSRRVHVEFVTPRGKATYLFGKKEMTLLLRKVSSVFIRRYGKKKFREVTSPNSRGATRRD